MVGTTGQAVVVTVGHSGQAVVDSTGQAVVVTVGHCGQDVVATKSFDTI